MVKLLQLYPDMTFTEKNKKTEQNKLLIDKGYTPEFKIGTSVFKERPKPMLIRLLTFWRKPRNLLLLVDGSPTAIHLEMQPYRDEETGLTIEKPALAFNFGTMKDTVAFLKKVTYKSIADRKPINNTQFLVLALLIGTVLMFQFMIMKGVKF